MRCARLRGKSADILSQGNVMPVLTEEEYYRAVPRKSLAERLLVAARDQIFRDFQARMRPSPSTRILDVGVSDVVNAGVNFLERCYPHPGKITACGLGEGTEFQIAFPAVGYVRIEPNVRLPFDDGSFDIAASNAVLEHVGSPQNQRFFVNELCRVAARIFITVPNRLFPIEHHTAVPIAHYADGLFKIACRITGQSQWAREENLILMTRRRLRGVAAPIGRSVQIGYTGLRLGPFSSNLYLVVR
jgi:Methyltransferase domain